MRCQKRKPRAGWRRARGDRSPVSHFVGLVPGVVPGGHVIEGLCPKRNLNLKFVKLNSVNQFHSLI